MFEICIGIYCLGMWFTTWAIGRVLKRQDQEIRELKRFVKARWYYEEGQND